MPRLLTLLLAAAGLCWRAPRRARAVVEIDITQGNLRPIPIAIPQFLGGGTETAQLAANIADIVAADLERSGLFKPIDRAAFVERIANIDVAPRFRDWRVVNAEALVVGQVSDDRRRPAQGAVPPVGRVFRPRAEGRGVLHAPARTGGASATSSPTRSMNG